jgi:transposase-like protein
MYQDNIITLKKPSEISNDPLLDILREGARSLLAEALETEITLFKEKYQQLRLNDGSEQVVRNGTLPQRSLQTGLGPIPVAVPRIKDRGKSGIKFQSTLVPPYLRRTKNIEELLPILYLKGISTGDFEETLAALVGDKAAGLSHSTICRLKESWIQDFETWTSRSLSNKRYVYFWADGVYLQARMEEKQCLLVIIGADEFGKKEIVAVQDGYRECEQSWREVLLDLKARGLEVGANLAIGDGALGFWKALRTVFSDTKEQRCWVHKTANILSKLPKSMQSKAKEHLHDIWLNATKEDALKSFDFFCAVYQDKYPKAVTCLQKDQEQLLEFYNFPAEQWVHIRTTNPIESTFATVRLRTEKTKGCLSRKTALTMTFKLLQSAEKRWKKLKGSHRSAQIIKGVNFVNGIAQTDTKEEAQYRVAA